MSESLPRIERALSIRQPWAWLVAKGYKSIENRSRSTNYRGWFAIHASTAGDQYSRTGKVTDKTREIADDWQLIYNDACDIEPQIERDLNETFEAKREADPDYQEFHFGAIIGVGRLVGCLPPTGDTEAEAESAGLGGWYAERCANSSPPEAWHEQDFFGWCVADAVLFDKPIPCKGALQFWKIPPQVQAEIASRLRSAELA